MFIVLLWIPRDRTQIDFDANRMISADLGARRADTASRSTAVGVGVGGKRSSWIDTAGRSAPGFLAERRQCSRYRNLFLRSLRERDANRVSDPIRQQRANSNRTLDASVLTIARLGDTDVEWIARRVRSSLLQPSCPCRSACHLWNEGA